MSSGHVPLSASRELSPLMMWSHIIAGLFASLIGIGFARFA